VFAIEVGAVDGADDFVGVALIARLEILGGEWIECEGWRQ